MILELFTQEFLQKLLLTFTSFALGGLALWTWQRKYWEYQLKRQRQDWILRQCYNRKDSQRKAMEQLLVEINEATENFICSTLLYGATLQRYADYIKKGGTEEGCKKWQEEVDKSANDFNSAEGIWLVKSRIIRGKLCFLFANNRYKCEKKWNEIIQQSERTCSLFHDPKITYTRIFDHMLFLRKSKDRLMNELQKEIDIFVSKELEIE